MGLEETQLLRSVKFIPRFGHQDRNILYSEPSESSAQSLFKLQNSSDPNFAGLFRIPLCHHLS